MLSAAWKGTKDLPSGSRSHPQARADTCIVGDASAYPPSPYLYCVQGEAGFIYLRGGGGEESPSSKDMPSCHFHAAGERLGGCSP